MTIETPHILYVITDLELGGVPLHLNRLAAAMTSRGFRVTVVSLKPTGPVGGMLAGAGICVLSCQGNSGWDFRVIPRLAEIIREQKPHIVHSLLFHANLAARMAAPRAEFPSDRILCEIQTVEVERRWHLWVDRLTYDQCRFTIGNSPSVIEHLADHARIPRDRLRLVRGGIDPAAVEAALPIPKPQIVPAARADTPLVLWVGRLDPVKGLNVLIEAFGRLARRNPAHLVLAGGGPLRGALERQISDLRLSGRVHLLGPRRYVPSLLKSCDVFAFPSRTEGLPNALLEAMAARLPIVTTNVPGCRDLIQHERNGLLVPFGDAGRLAEAMLRLLEDDALAANLAAAAGEAVARDWHISRMLDDYERLYRGCLRTSLVL